MSKKVLKRNIKLPSSESSLDLDYERYLPQMKGLIHYEHLHRYLMAAEFSAGKDVLDIACGEGYGCTVLSQVSSSVVGIDVSKKAINLARKKYKNEKIEFIESDATSIPLEDHSIDVAVSFETLEHLEDHDSFIGEVKRVLKKDGLFIISSPNKYVFSAINGVNNDFHISEITEKEFSELINSYFKNIKILNQQAFGASHISSLDKTCGSIFFEKNEYNEIIKNGNFDNAIYNIAVASNSDLPPVLDSYYVDTINKYNGVHCYDLDSSLYGHVIEELRQEITRYCALLEQKEADIAHLGREVSQKNDELVRLVKTHEELLAQKEADLAELQRGLSQKKSEMSLLSQEYKVILAQKETDIAYLAREVAQKDSELSLLSDEHKTTLVQKEADIAHLGRVVSHKDDELSRASQDHKHLMAHKKDELLFIKATNDLLLKIYSPDTFFSSLKKKTIERLLRPRNKALLRSSALFDLEYYVAENPDLEKAGVDPYRHYLQYGWKELRNPSQSFDTRKYLIDNPDVLESGINPLVHYIRHGQAECRSVPNVEQEPTGASLTVATLPDDLSRDLPQNDHPTEQPAGDLTAPCLVKEIPAFEKTFSFSDIPCTKVTDRAIEAVRDSRLFSEEYYRRVNKDIAAANIDFARHYCEHGWREGRNPSALFDTAYYLEMNPDIRVAGINPLYHYIISGKEEGRFATSVHGSEYEDDCCFGEIETDIKPIAFYLPQFHEIPENNKWWGQGFTEWTNTRKGKPRLEGHYQPRIPNADIGYYDLSDWRVLQQQAEIAKKHGIHGFCFYHYWFAGKRLLEKPVNMLLEHPEIDLPFCLCWANENWTRRWDGHNEDILMAQMHSEADDIAFIDDLKKYLVDKRYIRIEGKPVILLYRPGLLPDVKETAARWRQHLRDVGIGEVYLMCAYGSFGDMTPPGEYGFDAGFEFPPNVLESHQLNFQKHQDSESNIYKYGQFVADVLNKRNVDLNKNINLYYSVMLEWDNAARRQKGATIFSSYASSIYRKWLDETIEITRKKHPVDKRFIFINAWNEWAEGTYLEPDERYGYLSLNETSRALCNIAPGRKLPKVSVIVPNYNHAPFLRERLNSIYQQTYKNIEVILMDDCSTDDSRKILDAYAEEYAEITRREYNETNSGGVFHQWAKGIKVATGELIWVAESDDFCDKDFLDTLVASFEDEAVLLAYAHNVFVDKDGKPLSEGGFEYYVGEIDENKWLNSYVETSHNEVRTALGTINTIPNASGVVFRKPKDLALLDDKDWLSMSVAGDWLFYLHIMHGGKIAYQAETSNYFRRYVGSAAETTYKREVFFKEVAKASYTVASMYDVPVEVHERSRKYFRDFYITNIGDNVEQFEEWYDFEAILEARKKRLPNVLVSLFAFYPGGAEIIAIRLANELKRQGIAVVLHSGRALPRENRVRKMLRSDIPLVETDNLAVFKETISEFGIEVLNSHHWHVQRYALDDATVFSGVSGHVATLHGMIEAEGGYNVTPDQLRVVDKSVNTWVYTADKNIEPFQAIELYAQSPEKYLKIPNGLEPPDEAPVSRDEMNIPEDAFVLCTVSRAIPEKGWVETIEVVKRARKISGKDIRLILIGNGELYDELCQKGVPDFVFMPGFDSRSVGYYASADIGIMLTRFKSESAPLTIIDCLFAGKPYIASDVGEIRNMLMTDDGMAGEVYELKDWTIPVKEVAQIVAGFASDKEKYAQVKSRVNTAAQKFRIDLVAQKYLDVFTQAHMDDNHSSDQASENNRPLGITFYETEFYLKFEDDNDTFLKKVAGYCPVCESKATFKSDHKWLRDNYRCEKCNSIPRQRYLQYVLHSHVPGWQEMEIHESSPCTDFIKRLAPAYTASQYYPDKQPGEKVGDFTNEDIENLTFAENSLDIFLSQDVLEHVFNPEQAIKEMLRVVRPGGYVIFTIPVFQGQKTIKRAQLEEDGNVEFLKDPVYHGNPVDSAGSLAVWDYGDDFIQNLIKWSGPSEVRVFNQPIPENGIEGEFLDVFMVKK